MPSLYRKGVNYMSYLKVPFGKQYLNWRQSVNYSLDSKHIVFQELLINRLYGNTEKQTFSLKIDEIDSLIDALKNIKVLIIKTKQQLNSIVDQAIENGIMFRDEEDE